MSQEKRRSPRYFFFASAELTEENSQVRVPCRVSELSLHGCYLDMMNPFPVDTVVHLTIESGNTLFETRAKSIHSTPNIGAGVTFLDQTPESQPILNRWLEQAAPRVERRRCGTLRGWSRLHPDHDFGRPSLRF